MTGELELRRKYTMRAHGRQMVFIKKSFESRTHVLTKAFLWALYLPDYPDLAVEVPAGGRYKPDLVQFDVKGAPVFWGEAGQVGFKKLQTLVDRFRSTHLVFAKWHTSLEPMRRVIEKELRSLRRSAPIDLISFPAAGDERFIDRNGKIQIKFNDVSFVRC
jgi:hypothetical protein